MSGNGSSDMENFSLPFFSCAASQQSSSNISVPAYWLIPPFLQSTVPYMATIEALFFFMAAIWNMYIMIGYFKSPKLLQEPANVLFFNLAIADFMLSWVILLTFVSQITGGFPLGHTDVVRCGLCQFLGFYLIALVTTTLHIHAALSIDRFLLLYKPVIYRNRFSWKKALIVVAGIWIFSIFFASTPFFTGLGSYEYSLLLVSCQPSWSGLSSRGIKNVYFASLITTEAMIPLLSVLVFSVFTYRITCKSLYSRYQRHLTFAETASTSELVRRTHRDNQKRVIYLFTSLLVVNTVNWLPAITTLAVVTLFTDVQIPLGVYLFGWLCYLLNPVAHPLIELSFIKGLRDVLTCHAKEHIICYRRCCKRRAPVLRLNNTPSFRQQRQTDCNGHEKLDETTKTAFQVTLDISPSPKWKDNVTKIEQNKRPSIAEMTRKYSFPFLDEPFEVVDYEVDPDQWRIRQINSRGKDMENTSDCDSNSDQDHQTFLVSLSGDRKVSTLATRNRRALLSGCCESSV